MREAAYRRVAAAATVVAGLGLVLVGGCYSGPRVGGREFPMQITTTPEQGATVYFIPYGEWVERVKSMHGDEAAVLEDGRFLKLFKVTEGKTPVTVYAPSYQFVVVVEKDGRVVKAREPVTPGGDLVGGAGVQNTVNVHLE